MDCGQGEDSSPVFDADSKYVFRILLAPKDP